MGKPGVIKNSKTVFGCLGLQRGGLVALGHLYAAAATITYTITGTGTGTTALDTPFGTFVTPFSDVPIEVQVLGNSTISGPDPTGHFIYAPTATLSGFGGTFPLDVTVADTPLIADGPLPTPVPGFGFVVFGYNDEPSSPGVFVTTSGFTGPGLDTYNLLGNFGPIPVTFFMLPDLDVTDGPEIDFTSITGATFSAVGVPEPAAWTVMLAGFAGLGAALRARRKPAPAAA